jgi:MarR family 2-MHQ and catechol resistance regulon transcriptional repressor
MGTHYKGSTEEVRALDAYIKLMRAAESVSARIHRHLKDSELTVCQFGALEALHHLGPLCQRELGDKLLRSGGNITMVVDNLEKRGLVRRERCSEDRRMIRVNLTPSGARLIRRVFPNHAKAVADDLSVLSSAEAEDLGRLCRKLGKRQ